MSQNTKYAIMALLIAIVISFAAMWYAYTEPETLYSPAVPLLAMSVFLILLYYYFDRKDKSKNVSEPMKI